MQYVERLRLDLYSAKMGKDLTGLGESTAESGSAVATASGGGMDAASVSSPEDSFLPGGGIAAAVGLAGGDTDPREAKRPVTAYARPQGGDGEEDGELAELLQWNEKTLTRLRTDLKKT